MKPIFTFVFACLFATATAAQDVTDTAAAPKASATPHEDSIILNGTDVDLAQFLWTNRLLIVFSDSPSDPRYIQQMEFLNARLDELAERDVVILTDTDPDTRSPLREKLRPRGFMLVLIVKDGTIHQRKPAPRDVRDIIRAIDKLPMRQQEVQERRAHPNGS